MADERDERIGHAIVKGNADLEAYYADLETQDTGALWTVANEIEPWEPVASLAPMIWRHAELRPQVLRALDLVSADDAGRRVVYRTPPVTTAWR